VLLVLPVGLEKKLNRLNVADPFIGSDDENVVEDKRVRYGICVNDRDDYKTEK